MEVRQGTGLCRSRAQVTPSSLAQHVSQLWEQCRVTFKAVSSSTELANSKLAKTRGSRTIAFWSRRPQSNLLFQKSGIITLRLYMRDDLAGYR